MLLFLGACGTYRAPATERVRDVAAPATYEMVGTCRTTEANRFDLITGMAEALRVEWFRVDGDSEILIDGRAGRLSDIRAGTVLRVRYRNTPTGYLAERVETVSPEPRGDA